MQRDLGVILPAAGSGSRLGYGIPKALVPLGSKTILEHSLRRFLDFPRTHSIVIAYPKTYRSEFQKIVSGLETGEVSIALVEGGEERQDSISNALGLLPELKWVAVHDAARPYLTAELISKTLADAETYGSAVAAVPVRDTLKRGDRNGLVVETIDRSAMWSIQTPQVFERELLMEAYKKAENDELKVTDDASMVEYYGKEVKLTLGDHRNIKITYPEDLNTNSTNFLPMRIGFGYDVHQLVENRSLILGGVTIPHKKGLLGHSDADALLHAIADAILGAAALGDIGTHFPDNDPEFKNADSRDLLRRVGRLVGDRGFRVGNIDATIVAEKPKMKPHIKMMQSNIAADLQIDENAVSIKATTSEKMGFVGSQQGIACHAVATILSR